MRHAAVGLALLLPLTQAAVAQEVAAPETLAPAPPLVAPQVEPVAPVVAPGVAPPALTPAPAAEAPAPEAPTLSPVPEAGPAVPAPEAAPAAADSAAAAAGQSLPDQPVLGHDLSPWGMFMAADVVVKSVMIGLAFASLVTWTVWLAKSLEILFAGRGLRRGLAAILGASDLDAADRALAGRRNPAAAMVAAARHEVEASRESLRDAGGPGLLQRVTSHLGRIEVRAGRRLIAGTGVLATIGATAPFVGLFGTVWGIMNAFIGISKSQTTNLAVVAPGIAEALLATALGLVAAIPAVVIYNTFARAAASYRALLGDASAGVERLVSRDLDHQRLEAATAFRRAAE